MMTFFSGQYAEFIWGAYGITFAVLLAMIFWVVATSRSRKREFAKLEADGIRRVSAKGDTAPRKNNGNETNG